MNAVLRTYWGKLGLAAAGIVVVVLVAVGPAGIVRFAKSIGYRLRYTYVTSVLETADVRLDVPYHRQEHSLSCEIAALRMALNYYDASITESDLLGDLPFDTREPRDRRTNTWGDPDVGFVGNIDGSMPNSGYGVYELPIAVLAEKYRSARIMTGEPLRAVLLEVAQKHPVVVWGSVGSGRDISWTTPEGKYVKAISGEHARVIIGFTGSIEAPEKIILHDPIYGTIVWSKETFLKNWATLDNKAVVVE